MDDWPYEESADDYGDADFTSSSRTSDDVDESHLLSRLSRPTATLSDFIIHSKSSARRRGKLALDEEAWTMECSNSEELLFNESAILARCNSSQHPPNQEGKAEVSNAFCGSPTMPMDDVTGCIDSGQSVVPSWFVTTSASTEKVHNETDATVDVGGDLQWSERNEFRCTIVRRSSIESFGGVLRDRFAESQSIPRRFLVDVSCCLKRRYRRRGRQYNRQRKYLFSEELHS